MACETWLNILSLLLLVMSYMQCYVHGEPQVPCMFIFGDSMSDNGNNNNLPTYAKVNYKPYGIDSPTGPTGRFTNGATTIDIISQLLGFEKFIPPFANYVGSDILKGVNYASGSAGIRVETGKHLGVNVNLGLQLANHRVIVSAIAQKLGGFQQALQYLNKCLYYVNIGSNDYINNYFLPELYPTSYIYSPQQYAEVLIRQLSLYTQDLHDVVGARKYVVVGAGLLGCTPYAMSKHGKNGSCVEDMNVNAFIYNDKLKSLVDQLNIKFAADSKFMFINTTAGTLDSSLGFRVSDTGCCRLRKDGQCIPNQTPCKNRNEYVFWDGFHPTLAVNRLVAKTTYEEIQPLVQTRAISSNAKGILKKAHVNMNKHSDLSTTISRVHYSNT